MSTFTFNRQAYEYFQHPYNHASQNSRTVEVPIALRAILEARRKQPTVRVLELGNVLSHYGSISWPVVDLREPGCINADIMTWQSPERYDLVISISTIEHIGYGRYARYTAPTTPARVLKRLRACLAPRGRILATMPTGYNAALDDLLRAGALGADRLWFMRRVSDANEWAECSMEEALAMPYYDGGHRWGGGLVILLCRGGA